MMTPEGLSEIAQLFLNSISHCRADIGFSQHTFNIHNVVTDNNRIDIYFIVDEDIQGDIKQMELISINDTVLARRPYNITKRSGGGIAIRFSFFISEN